MLSLPTFLYFLQKHELYYHYQDSFLETLSLHAQSSVSQILTALQNINPVIVAQTHALMLKSVDPFPNSEIHRVRYGESIYPEEFKHLIDPPLVFSYLGQPVWQRNKISVVGSRHPSQKSLWWFSKELKSIIRGSDLVSVSGGAIGVDQLVHQASIDLKAPTVVVLPSGLSSIYPKSMAEMAKMVVRYGGCLLSEFPDRQAVMKHHFSYRNRLIAAFGKVCVIAEAREKSGTLITAHRALEMGKDLFVVPGHPLDESFRGSLNLLKLGAHILTEAQDLEYWL